MPKNNKILHETSALMKKEYKILLKEIKKEKKKALKKIKKEREKALDALNEEKQRLIIALSDGCGQENSADPLDEKGEEEEKRTEAAKINTISENDYAEPHHASPPPEISSIGMKASEAISRVSTYEDTFEIDQFMKGEKRSTVKKAAENRKKELKRLEKE